MPSTTTVCLVLFGTKAASPFLTFVPDHTRIARLKHIAQVCPSLSLEALHLAIPASKNAKDPALYLSLASLLRNIDPNDSLASPDLDWVDKANKMNEQEADRLEHELRGYKNNLIKESIRVRILLLSPSNIY